jgi:outer membrane biosynthesis protein TonB
MSKARKIMTYLMVGIMFLSNFQNRLYANDEEPSAPAEPVVADTPVTPEPEPAPEPEPEPVVVPDPEPETPEVPSEPAGQPQEQGEQQEGDQPTSDSDETQKT